MRLGIFIAMLIGIAWQAHAAEEYDMKPTIGRIVHYQAHGSPDGTHPSVPRAAIVTDVHDDKMVDLCVINPTGQYFNHRCRYSEEPKGGTWRWPPRSEEKASEKPSDVLPILEESIARIAHEANRAYCLALGDDSQPAWDDAPEWQRTSAINGVKFHLQNPGASPSASHDNWLAEKLEQGWKYGPVKDPEKREHPCCVPYDQLPAAQQTKDKLFSSIVRAFV